MTIIYERKKYTCLNAGYIVIENNKLDSFLYMISSTRGNNFI